MAASLHSIRRLPVGRMRQFSFTYPYKVMKRDEMSGLLIAITVSLLVFPADVNGQKNANIFDALIGETVQQTDEISTSELQQILADESAYVFDARPFLEYSISHIPGAVNVSAKPGIRISMYISDVAEILRVVNGAKQMPIVLYCNGPFCGKSNRLANELLKEGFTNVRRYQLGIPVWRALGGITQIEPEGLRYVYSQDDTAVFVDIREEDTFRNRAIAKSRNIPRSLVLTEKDTGEVGRAKDDGRLPMNDHNTRIIVIGDTPEDVQYVAEALTAEAFQNVAFFSGTFEEAISIIER